MLDWTWLDWLAAALLGGIVGASELTSRYKDSPAAALRTWPARFYIAINCAASVGAPGLIHANGWFNSNRWTGDSQGGHFAAREFSITSVSGGDSLFPISNIPQF